MYFNRYKIINLLIILVVSIDSKVIEKNMLIEQQESYLIIKKILKRSLMPHK